MPGIPNASRVHHPHALDACGQRQLRAPTARGASTHPAALSLTHIGTGALPHPFTILKPSLSSTPLCLTPRLAATASLLDITPPQVTQVCLSSHVRGHCLCSPDSFPPLNAVKGGHPPMTDDTLIFPFIQGMTAVRTTLIARICRLFHSITCLLHYL